MSVRLRSRWLVRMAAAVRAALPRVACGVILMAFASVAQALGSIEGLWTTFDDDSNARRGTVEITPAAGEWIGRVVEVFAAPDEDTNPRCAACSGADRNRLIVGMDILHV